MIFHQPAQLDRLKLFCGIPFHTTPSKKECTLKGKNFLPQKERIFSRKFFPFRVYPFQENQKGKAGVVSLVKNRRNSTRAVFSSASYSRLFCPGPLLLLALAIRYRDPGLSLCISQRSPSVSSSLTNDIYENMSRSTAFPTRLRACPVRFRSARAFMQSNQSLHRALCG